MTLAADYRARLDGLRVNTLEALTGGMVANQQTATVAQFDNGDSLLANTTDEQLKTLGYPSAAKLCKAVGEQTGISKRRLQYLMQVSAAFPDVILPDGTELRGLNIAWNTYRIAMEKTTEPIFWAIYAHNHNGLSGAKMLQAYSAAGGELKTAERVTFTLKNAEARAVRVEGCQITFEFAGDVDLNSVVLNHDGQMTFAQLLRDNEEITA